MTRSDALYKNDSKRQAILITDVLSGEEQVEHYQLAAVQMYTENYARGTAIQEALRRKPELFTCFSPLSLRVDSTLS